MFIVYVLISLVPLFTYSLISYRLSANTIRSDYVQYMTNLTSQILRNMDANMLMLQKQSSAFFLVRNDIAYILTANELDDIDRYFEVRSRLDQYFLSHLQINAKLNGITLIDAEGEMKYAINAQSKNSLIISVKNEEWFQKTLKLNGTPLFRGPHINEFIFGDPRPSVISVSQSMVDYTAGKPIGALVVDQNADQFFNDAANVQLEPEEQIVIVSETGNIVYTKQEMPDSAKAQLMLDIKENGDLSSIQFGGQRTLMIASAPSAFGFRVISLLPEAELNKKSSFLRTIPSIMLLVVAGLVLVISIFVSYLIVKPLRRLMSSFKKLETGNFSVRVPVNGSHELAHISSAFNRMVENIESLITEKYEANLLRQQAEFEALQSQINPHFLYNTLYSTRSVIDKRDFREAANMIDSLAGIFRYSLNPGEPVVTLQDELDHAHQYLYLLETRFPGKFRARFDIDDSLRECAMLRLTLQPILENAIKHGLHDKTEGGEIRIAAQSDGEQWQLYVHDNGCGIPADKLNSLRAGLQEQAEAAPQANRHIGIRNVHYRIRYHFGSAYGVAISSRVHAYTTVMMSFPLQGYREESCS
ncbi:cache domain-containing sensor histidine kinase [Cohnella fermenti]|uniref:cache domain-containing sensor histidine kinase n=1 Tax=Cohnella fermenti TaxID=2565925 RepID=UPI001454D94D|nr:sensor histidine kinase [Cohnella fermenti]